MNLEELKSLIRLFIEDVWNKGYFTGLEAFLEPDFMYHNPVFPATGNGIEGYKRILSTMREGFPDQHWTLEDMIAEGDRVVTRWTMKGTHTGIYLGIAPTFKTLTINGVSIYRFVGGKIAEEWVLSDALGMLRQEGFVVARREVARA